MSVTYQGNKIISGTFDSEEFWREKNLARLPSVEDRQSVNIVMAMDELMFVFCDSCGCYDTLITRFEMDKEQKHYLDTIGFHFQARHLIENYGLLDDVRKKNACQLLLESQNMPDFISENSKKAEYSPFSVLEESKAVSQKFNLDFDNPSVEVIKKVNSKVYSFNMNRKMGRINNCHIVYSSEELRKRGEELLRNSNFLIKDTFGVSGKGNLLISSLSVLNHIADYFSKQEKKGKQVLFIIEPFLEKDFDFSCQFFIDKKNGQTDIISLQRLRNKNFTYEGSFTAEDELLDLLEGRGYFKVIMDAAKQLYADGYFGHVCIDSMVLKTGDIVPIVEINARHSMSLIKHQLDHYLSESSLKCSFTYFSLHFIRDINYGEILEKMQKQGILYNLGKTGGGIIPLSSNTLLINQKIQKGTGDRQEAKGRFYVAFAYENDEQQAELNKGLLHFLEENSLYVY